MLARIEAELLGRGTRRTDPSSYETEAAVSLILRPSGAALEFLAIKRAEHDRDPWSGHMALPGGRREGGDPDLWGTAVRETREEVDLDLDRVGRRLGRLDDVLPRSRRLPSIAITPFVAAVPTGTQARTSPEVDRTLWVPAGVLLDDRYRGRLRLPGVEEREFATVEYDSAVIWGLTLSILGQFEEVLRRAGYGGRGA